MSGELLPKGYFYRYRIAPGQNAKGIMCTQSYNFHLRAEPELHIKLFDFTLQALLITLQMHRCV